MSGWQQALAVSLRDPAAPPAPGLRVWNGSDPALRLAVHRNNRMVSLIQVLADSFPVVQTLVGESFFAALARQHVLERPPRSLLMHAYGAGFADWLADFEPVAGLPYLPDVARLEWARWQALQAAEMPALPPAALAERLNRPEALPGSRLQLRPGAQLLRSAHPLLSIWAAHQQDDPGAALAALDLQQGEQLLVLRVEETVCLLPLDPPGHGFLAALLAGQCLGDAWGLALQRGQAFDLIGLLSQLIRHQALVAWRDGPQPEDP